MLAIQGVWPQIRDYLSSNNITEVALHGKSQGGAHVQYLAPLIQSCTKTKVTDVVTYASIGVDSRVEEIFYNVFQNLPVQVAAIFNEGDIAKHEIDFVPFVGGVHVGLRQKNALIYSIAPGSIRSQVNGLSTARMLLEFAASFRYGHTRQTTLKSYGVQKITDTSSYFVRGKELDRFRKVAAWVFYILSFGFLYRVSYENFYKKSHRFSQ